VGSLFRQCARGEAERDGGDRAFKGAVCGVWGCLCTRPGWGVFPVSNTGGRSGKALRGGYGSPIQLPAGASRTSRTEPRRDLQGYELLQIAVPYELGLTRTSIHGNFGALYPIYVRGEGYLAAHRGAEAATEFRKILDHRQIVLSDPIGALAHLQLGRAFTLSGDKIKAKTAYQDFLTLWKDADPDIPILKQAKAEYSKLQ
jgi:hypothetical protein